MDATFYAIILHLTSPDKLQDFVSELFTVNRIYAFIIAAILAKKAPPTETPKPVKAKEKAKEKAVKVRNFVINDFGIIKWKSNAYAL